MSGFHVEWLNVGKKYKAVQHTRIGPVSASKVAYLKPAISDQHPLRVSLLEQPAISEEAESNKSHAQFPTMAYTSTSPCDTIIMRSGEIVLGVVIEIQPQFVTYKNCHQSDSIVTVVRNEIAMIKYHTGAKETFEVRDEEKIMHPLAKTSFDIRYFKYF